MTRPAWPRQLGGEILKMVARPRSSLGFVVFLLVELVILGLLQLPSSQRAFARLLESNGYLFEEYFSGLTMAFVMLKFTVFLIGGLYLALVGGDVVAKEVEDGTMRMVLCRPVSRWRVLMIKYAACLLYTAVLMAFITFSSLAAGIAFRGWGGLFAYSPVEKVFGVFGPGEGLLRFTGGAVLLGISTATITSLAFCLSCFDIKPAAAAIVTLSVLFLDFVIQMIPYFDGIQGYLLTTQMGVWQQIFQDVVPWWGILSSLFYLAAIDATLFWVGCLVFEGRDLKS